MLRDGMEDEEQLGAVPNESELEQYAARTRRSLIVRLQDWQDRKSWDEFYRSYWRLIYTVAIRAGLREHEAWDVVQDTVLCIAKQSRKGMYDPEKGSFKTWLWGVTRWRIKDTFRNRKKNVSSDVSAEGEEQPETVVGIPDTESESFDKIWEREWQHNIIKAAIERVKMKVSPSQFQIYDLRVLREMSTAEVCKRLGVRSTQVHLAKHRVGSIMRKEIEFIRAQGESKPS